MDGICGRQPLKNLNGQTYGLLKQTIPLQIFQRLSSTNFTWSILEYFVPYFPSITKWTGEYLISKYSFMGINFRIKHSVIYKNNKFLKFIKIFWLHQNEKISDTGFIQNINNKIFLWFKILGHPEFWYGGVHYFE